MDEHRATPTPPTSHMTPPPPQQEQRPPQRRSGFNIWRIGIGLLIVLFGLSLLGNQLGFDLQLDVWRLWPVVVILAGVSILTSGRHLSPWIAVVLAVGIIGIAGFLAIAPTASYDLVAKDIAIPKDPAATSSEVTISMGAAKVRVDGGSDQAVTGRYESRLADLETASTLSGSIQRVTLDAKSREARFWIGSFRNELRASLNRDVPVDLRIASGAADLDLDLSAVKATSVDVDAGASSIDLTLGDLVDAVDVDIDSGASSIVVTIPRTVGVQLRLDAGLSGKDLPELTSTGENRYESANFATAAKKATIAIDAGASSIAFRWK